MPAEKKRIAVKVCPFCRKRPFVINNMGVPSIIYCTNLDCAMYCVYTPIEKWNRRADTKVKKLTASNKSIPKFPTLAECQAHVQREMWSSHMLANSISMTERVYNFIKRQLSA